MYKEIIKKGLTIGTIFIFLSLATFPLSQAITPISIDNTLYVGGSGPGNYTKIQYAIENSSNGDTVFVYAYSSPYYENIIVDKSINLIGENRDTTSIIGVENWSAVLISEDYVKMNGFSILDSGGMSLTAAIDIRSNFTTIENNYITTNRSSGVNVWGLNNTIEKNIIESNRLFGICLLVCNSNNIIGNIILKNGIGIGLFESNTNIVEGNNISENLLGIVLNGSNENIISSNIISRNILNGIILYYSNRNTIKSNTINYSICGVELISSNRNKILQNNFMINNRNAYFENCVNRWRNNYWNRPRLLPKPITGSIRINIPFPFQDLVLRWRNFDLRPSLKKHNIGE